MPVVQLTPSFINNLTAQPGKARTEWCDKNCPGLYVEARATSPGNGTYYLRYRGVKVQGAGALQTRHLKLGTTNEISLAEARAKAKEKLAEIRLGADPRGMQKQSKTIPTLKAFCEASYVPLIKMRNRSWKDDVNRLNCRIYPAFGEKQLHLITSQEIVDFHIGIKAAGLKGATADLHLSLLKRIFKVGNDLEVITVNPTERVQLFRDPNKVEHYLNEEQLSKLMFVLQTHKKRAACNLFMFLLASGARLNECLTMTWDQVDLAQRVWKVPATTSKSKKLRVVPLNDSALDILKLVQPEVLESLVFRNPNGQPIKSVQRIWNTIRTAAGIPFYRLHDNRHQLASLMLNAGRTLVEVQHVLGHQSHNTTLRYAHMSASTLQDAVASADKGIQAAMPKFLPVLPSEQTQ